MRQAIETKYLAPTNFRGARVKAECAAGHFIMPWQSELSPEMNHYRAAVLLTQKLNWDHITKKTLIGGVLKNGRLVWVVKPRDAS